MSSELMRLASFNAELGFASNVRQRHMQRVLFEIVGGLQGIRAARELCLGMRRRPVVNDYLDEFPPWRMRTLARMESEVHRVGFGSTRESLAEIVAVLIRERVAVVEIDRAAALRSR